MPAPQGRQPKVEDDDLDAELAALDAAIKSGNPSKLTSAVEGLLDDDARPPHEGDEDDAPAPKKAAGKKAKKAAEPVVDEEDEAHDDDADGGSDGGDERGSDSGTGAKKKVSPTVEEDDEGVVEDVDESEADLEDVDGDVPAKTVKGPGPLVKNLIALGYQVGGALDEETAAQLLVRHHADTSKLANDNAHLIRLGQMVASNPELYQQLAGQKKTDADEGNTAKRGGQDAAAAKTESPAALQKLAALGEKWKGLAKKPEYDPEWEHSGVQFNGRMYVAPANNAGLAPIAEKLNAYRKWQLQQMEVSTDLPDILESVQEAIKGGTGAGFTADQVKEIIRETIRENSGKSEHQAVAMDIAQKNAPWMFMYAGEQPVRTPAGNFVFTPEGEKYNKYFEMLVAQGMNQNDPKGLRAISDIAVSLVGVDLDKAAKKAPHKKAASGVDASGAAGKKLGNDTSDEGDELPSAAADKAANLKARRKEMASGKPPGKTGISKQGGRSDDRSDRTKVVNPAKSLAAEFAEELAKAGITDGNLTFGDGDGDDD